MCYKGHMSAFTETPDSISGPFSTDGTDPQVSILLDEKLRQGIAAQLRALANILDPPKEKS